MDALDALMTTRAIRRFTNAPVTDEEIIVCLRAAQQAPSGGNVQPLQYVVVQDAGQRRVLGALYRRAYERYEKVLSAPPSFRSADDEASWRRTKAASDHLAQTLHDVPAIVVFLQPVISWIPSDGDGPLDIGRLDASVYPAVQNFMVAARSLGIGTALTTVIRIETAAVLEALCVSGSVPYEIAALVPMGRPVGSFGVARRKPVEAVTHWDRWGNRRR